MRKFVVGVAAALICGWAVQSEAAVIVTVESITVPQPVSSTPVTLDVYLNVTGADLGKTLSAYSIIVGVPSGITAGSPIASLITSGTHTPAFNGGNFILSTPVGSNYGVNDGYGTGGITLADGVGLFKVNLTVPASTAIAGYNVPITFVELTDSAAEVIAVDSTSTGVINVVAVPEPTSLGLLFVGGLLLSRRRR